MADCHPLPSVRPDILAMAKGATMICTTCNGAGRIYPPDDWLIWADHERGKLCPSCHGTGETDANQDESDAPRHLSLCCRCGELAQLTHDEILNGWICATCEQELTQSADDQDESDPCWGEDETGQTRF
jgi:hypothetical protein